MTQTITYNANDNLIEVKVQGDLTLNQVKEIALEVLRVSKEQNCLYMLTDLREATVKLAIIEIYELPKVFSTMAGLDIYKLKRAFVAPKGQADLTFFENVTFNNSQNARYFFDMEEARNWLLGK